MRASRALTICAGHRLQHADDALHQRRLARAVGADDRRQRAGRDGAAEMMHGRVAAVAERQIAEDQARLRHRSILGFQLVPIASAAEFDM